MTEPMVCHVFGVACDAGLRSSFVDSLTLLGVAYCLWAATGFRSGDGSGSGSDSDGGGGCGGD